jgi:hypothetical protein
MNKNTYLKILEKNIAMSKNALIEIAEKAAIKAGSAVGSYLKNVDQRDIDGSIKLLDINGFIKLLDIAASIIFIAISKIVKTYNRPSVLNYVLHFFYEKTDEEFQGFLTDKALEWKSIGLTDKEIERRKIMSIIELYFKEIVYWIKLDRISILLKIK